MATSAEHEPGLKANEDAILTNGSQPSHKEQENIPVTEILSAFIANVSPSSLDSALRTKLTEVIIDYIGVTLGAITHSPSTPSIFKAISGLSSGGGGPCTVFARGHGGYLPHYAALLNAAFGHSLDFDDTYAPGTLHAGVTVIPTALAVAESLEQTSGPVPIDRFLLSIAVGYEITCRLGRELGYEAYSQGMHNTATSGIFGAVATICVIRQLPVKTVEMAFGIAGSKAAGSMQYLENGSWNKRLHPGFACHDAFMSVALAEAGVLGATKIIEGKFGFLKAYSPNPNKDLNRLVSGLPGLPVRTNSNSPAELGHWEWLESSLKPYPACRMTHGIIEMADQIRSEENISSPSDVESVTLYLSPPNWSVVGQPTANKIHPENIVDAQFSAYYQSSMSLLHGSNLAIRAYEDEVLLSPDIRALASKTAVVKDENIKDFGSRMKIHLSGDGGGRMIERDIPHPLGERQHPFTKDKVEEKFKGLVDGLIGREKGERILRFVEELAEGERGSVRELMGLLA